MNPIWHWFLTVTGTNDTSGQWYGWWSGFGSDLGEIAILGGLIAAYRKHACHVDGCYRIARHPVEGTPYIVCQKHHPGVPGKVTAWHIGHAFARRGGVRPPEPPIGAK